MTENKKTILLVEDDVILAMAEGRMLEKHGYAVITANSGEDAVEMAMREKGIDLILMDIDLGRGMDGTEAAEIILKARHVPVMFLSSHTEPAVVEKTEGITSYGYVVKNTGETVLLASIRMAFRLFAANERIEHQREDLESANEELQATVEELEAANEEYEVVHEELVRSEEEIRLSEERYHSLYLAMNDGSCLHEIIRDDAGVPVDYRILDVNPRYEEITGLVRTKVIGQLASEVYGAGLPPYLGIYAETAKTGEEKVFETYFEPMDKYFRVSVYSPGTGKFVTVFQDISEQKELEEALRKSESVARNKLASILSPNGDLDALELGDIIDVGAIQSLMDDFYRLMGIGIAILDIEGRVLVATGWQDICVKFHRVNPATLKNCLESDISLSAGINPGTYRIYRCKNNMYDMATPIIVGKRHVGNLFLGQFFYDDDPPDRDFYSGQAAKFGFDEEEYLEALDRVPRWSRDTVDAVMGFYTKFAHMISTLSHGNIVLARIVSELDRVNEELRRSEERYRVLAENTSDVIWTADLNLKTTYVSPSVERLIGDDPEIHLTRTMEERFSPEDLEYLAEVFMEELEKEKDPHCDRNRSRMVEVRHRRADGNWIWVEINMTALRDEEGNMIGIQGVTRDISSRKNSEEALEAALHEKKTLLRELQHRVKNSMSMITSLIHLEQDRAVDVPVRTALEDLHGRVSVLSNLYGLLYAGDSMEIPTGEYLRKIAGSLSEAFSDRKMIRLHAKFDDVLINPKIASTLGLIMNELVTNAYKYAFPDDRSGAVRVELSRRNGGLELLVADNGDGPPEGFCPESTSGFGLELVRMLVRQIKGRFEYMRDRETVFRVMWEEV